MFQNRYKKTQELITRKRYALLLLSTVLTLILPAFMGSGLLFEIVFTVAISFLFVQSMLAANLQKSGKKRGHYIVLGLIIASGMKPLGIDWIYIDVLKATAFVAFFIFVISYLFRFIVNSSRVNGDVLITSVNIYLLGGIIGAFLSYLLYRIYPDSYLFPGHISHPTMVNFLYYSFITMSTVGYGDITPKIQETQTLAYLLSVAGQLYVAIIIAFLVGKLLAAPKEI